MTYLIPFVNFLISVLDIYSFLLIVWVVMAILNNFEVINRRHAIIIKIMNFLEALYTPPLKVLRKFIPVIGSVDITPVILYLLIQLTKSLVLTLVY